MSGTERDCYSHMLKLLLVIMLPVLFITACSIEPTPTPTRVQNKEPFPMTLDTSKTYIATLRTDKGDIVIELAAEKAPITVNNFVNLAKQGYYTDSTFHRVLPDFMAQGGDPTGTGTGGPGYTIEDEFTDLVHDRGVLSMANTGRPNTGGGQWFITLVPTPHLDGKHAVFGKVVEGMDVVDSLTPRDPSQSPDYDGDKLLEVLIEEQ